MLLRMVGEVGFGVMLLLKTKEILYFQLSRFSTFARVAGV